LIKLIFEIAIGYVIGQILWEFLLAAAQWTGRAVVRGFTGMMRLVIEQRKASNG
jgi:hypothetical protein